jgi:hypothetical protein
MASTRIYRSRARTRVVLRFAMTSALGACAHLGAPGPVVADRPGYTDTPVALPAGAVQLEAGATDDRVGPSGSRTEYVSAGETLLRLGFGGRTEARLFGNSYGRRTASGAGTTGGLEDFKLGAKLNLRSAPDSVHSWAPNVALLAATTLPTGASGFGATSSQPEAKVAMNWTTASPFSLYTNVGYGDIVNETGRAGKGWVSAASRVSIRRGIGGRASEGQRQRHGGKRRGRRIHASRQRPFSARREDWSRAGERDGQRAVLRGGIGKTLVNGARPSSADSPRHLRSSA